MKTAIVKKGIIYSVVMVLVSGPAMLADAGATSSFPVDSDTLAVTKNHNTTTSIWAAKLRGGAVDIDRLTGKNSHSPAWSPSGQKLAYIKNDRLHVMDKNGDDRHSLTHAKGFKETNPVWSPDGTKIAFVRTETGNSERSAVYTIKLFGHKETNVSGWLDDYGYRAPSWSPESDKLVYEKYNDTDAFLVIETLKDNSVATLTELSEVTASSDVSWSPNGKKILYKDSSNEIYTIWPDGSHRAVISDGDSYQASWSRSGDRMVFIEDPGDASLSIGEKDGTVVWLPIQKGEYDEMAYPTWSPDEDKIAFIMIKNAAGGYRSDLFMVDLKGDTAQPRLLVKNSTGRPSWR